MNESLYALILFFYATILQIILHIVILFYYINGTNRNEQFAVVLHNVHTNMSHQQVTAHIMYYTDFSLQSKSAHSWFKVCSNLSYISQYFLVASRNVKITRMNFCCFNCFYLFLHHLVNIFLVKAIAMSILPIKDLQYSMSRICRNSIQYSARKVVFLKRNQVNQLI